MSLAALTSQLDAELSKSPRIDADHILLPILDQLSASLGSSDELSDIFMDLVPFLLCASERSNACEESTIRLLDLAAEQCTAPREVYTALSAALNSGDEESSAAMQRCLIVNLGKSVGKIERKWLSFYAEYLDMAVGWLERSEDIEAFKIGVKCSSGRSEEGNACLNKAVYQAADIVLEQRGRSVCVEDILLAAQSTLSGKLLRFQPALVEMLKNGPAQILELLLENIEEEMQYESSHAAVCCSILLISDNKMPCISALTKTSQFLTDLAAQYQSLPFALLPLLLVLQFAKATTSSPCVADLDPITSLLATIMSLHPVEIVRSCAHEAFQSLLDALTPSARLVVLKRMIHSDTAAVVVIALQRLRLEISPAVLVEPFTQQTALDLSLPFLKRGPGGWESPQDVMECADVLSAALSVLRFVLLMRERQQQALEMDSLLNNDLKPLQVCAVHVMEQLKAEQESSHVALEMYLAVERMHDVLDRVVELLQS